MTRTPRSLSAHTFHQARIRRDIAVRRSRVARLRLDALEERTVPATPDAVTIQSYSGNITLELRAPGKMFDHVEAVHPPYVLARIPAMPYGMVQYEVQGVTPGGVAVVDLVLPNGLTPTVYYKQDPVNGTIDPFDFNGRTGAVIHGNIVTLYLQDGGRGDADGLANGVIDDPGGPGFGTDLGTVWIPADTDHPAGESGLDRVIGTSQGAAGLLVPNSFSAGTVRYGTGQVELGSRDLSSGGFGKPWGQTRSWTNLAGYDQGSQLGVGWATAETPYLIQVAESGDICVVTNADVEYRFSNQAGTYVATHNGLETLTYSAANHEFTLTDTTGNVFKFSDFDISIPSKQQGGFKQVTDPDGTVTAVTSRDSSGRITEVQRSRNISGTVTYESYLTNYLTTGTNAGRVSDVTLRRKVGTGSWTTIRKVLYSYYDGTTSNGAAGDLARAVVKDPSDNIISTDYYRYYTANSSTGYTHGLKYYVGGEQYARLEADQGSAANVDSASDVTIAPYLSNYFEYQSDKRVTKLILAGAGDSTGTGQGTFTYAYTDSANGQAANNWKTKTVETRPDGTTNTVYTNAYGGMLLKAHAEGGQTWIEYWQYAANGGVLLHAAPSAVISYSDVSASLGVSLRSSAGLITTQDFGSSTTATSSTAGDVLGYLKTVNVKMGQSGTAVPQESFKYLANTAGGVTIYPVAEETGYRNTNGTGAETVTHGYTFFSGTNRVQQETVTRPAATTGQNGSGSTDADVVVNDSDGRPVWTKDAAGFINYVEYDPVSGAVTKTISDVDTTQTGTFNNLPSGWATPTGGGLHLTATVEADALARPTKVTSPAGNISYEVYNDAGHEVRIYPGWDSTNNVPNGPTQVARADWARGYHETLTMSATPTVSGGRPTGAENISGVQSLSRAVLNQAGQTIDTDEYFDLSGTSYSQTSVTLGTSGTNYNRTQLGYGANGLLNRTVTPTGTIYRTVSDGLGRPVSKWVGTDDTPTSGTWSPTNTAGTDLVKIEDLEYDSGGVGDSNLTKDTLHPGGGAADRVTAMAYDWRDRPVATKAGVEGTESTSVNRPITYLVYDNLNEVTETDTYDGDGLSITTDSNSDGVPDAPSSSALRAQETTAYDEQGRAYQEKTFSVDPSTGSVSTNALVTNHWYNSRGLEMKTASPGGLVTKRDFDGIGRTTKSYVTDGGGDTAYGDADDETGDAVLSQAEWIFDADSNQILVTTRDRFHDETGTGTLGTPASGVKARVSYSASYFDKADRKTTDVAVGTNGGSAYTRPGTPDARDNNHLRTDYGYNAAGLVSDVTDPRGLVSKTYYDFAGRTTKTIEKYVDGVVSDVDDKTIEFTYNGNGAQKTLTADLTGGGHQTTENVYGVSTSGGLVSNDIVGAVKHPDPSTGDASTSQQDSYTVNQLGEAITFTDRNGSVHTYTRDVLGRVTVDAITTLGTGVDGAIRRIETAYDGQGNAYLVTSYDAATSGNIVNQVQRAFNGLGQLTQEWQATSGAVNTSSSPSVQYAYSFAPSGSTNHSRLTSITYPNGRVVTYNYATGLSDNISRLSSITDGATTLESYQYLGLDTVVTRGHAQPGVDLTFVKLTGESDGSAGDKYVGLDRFGRDVDQRWTTSGGTPKDRFGYGYDRDGNRLYKENLLDSTRSELNAYDGFNQLTSFQRGTLNGTKDGLTGSASRSQSWDFDALGNFDSQTTDSTTQTRSHNKQNEITSVSGATTPTYDNNGNLTKDEAGRTFKYDAWNRLVEVRDSGNNLLATYRYDPFGRRVRETRGSTTTDLYYSSGWQVLEERVGGVVNSSYVWSPAYVDALVARDRDTNGDGGLDERLYAAQDANWNVTALFDTSGNVVERYAYDPFGGFAVLTPTWGSRASSSYAWKYQHQGLKWDADLGAYDDRGRVYGPTLARFYTLDPMGFGAGDVDLYRYVGNQPTETTDPSGLEGVPPRGWTGDDDFRNVRPDSPVEMGIRGGAKVVGGAILVRLGVLPAVYLMDDGLADLRNSLRLANDLPPDMEPFTDTIFREQGMTPQQIEGVKIGAGGSGGARAVGRLGRIRPVAAGEGAVGNSMPRIGGELGRGTEGVVYENLDDPAWVVKQFHKQGVSPLQARNEFQNLADARTISPENVVGAKPIADPRQGFIVKERVLSTDVPPDMAKLAQIRRDFKNINDASGNLMWGITANNRVPRWILIE